MKTCPKCNSSHEKAGKFCSRRCANGRPQSESTKEKQSAALRGKETGRKGEFLVPRFERSVPCIICGKMMTFLISSKGKHRSTCSDECARLCMSEGGKKSAEVQAQTRRSKNEKLFAELCSKHFEVRCNERLFEGWDADVILPREKVAILWNGKWHYEKLKKDHSVEQVRTRDRLKKDAIKRCGFSCYVVKDMGSFDEEFVKEQFGELVKWLSRGSHKAE